MMGSYGVGVSRLVGAIIEASHDDAGIVWPESVAPWKVGLVTMRGTTSPRVAAAEASTQAYAVPASRRSTTTATSGAGPSSARMDLIGLPWQVIVGPRGIAVGHGRTQAPFIWRTPGVERGIWLSRGSLNDTWTLRTHGREALSASDKGEGFIFVVAGFSVGAVALGVAALIIVMSVMNGFRAELFDKIVGLNGHAIVQGYEGRLSDWQNIADATRKTARRDVGARR